MELFNLKKLALLGGDVSSEEKDKNTPPFWTKAYRPQDVFNLLDLTPPHEPESKLGLLQAEHIRKEVIKAHQLAMEQYGRMPKNFAEIWPHINPSVQKMLKVVYRYNYGGKGE